MTGQPPDPLGFKHNAKPLFGTVSGPATAYRVAVRNKTHLKQLNDFAEVYGATATIKSGATFPALALITFPESDLHEDYPGQHIGGASACNHNWVECEGEPPVDICNSCGEVRS